MAKMQGCTDGKTTILCVCRHCGCCYGSKECEDFRIQNQARVVRGLVSADCTYPSHQRPGVNVCGR